MAYVLVAFTATSRFPVRRFVAEACPCNPAKDRSQSCTHRPLDSSWSAADEGLTIWQIDGGILCPYVATVAREFKPSASKDGIVLGYFGPDQEVCLSTVKDRELAPDKPLLHEVGIAGIIRHPTLVISPNSRVIAYSSVVDTAVELWDFPIRQQTPVRLLETKGVVHKVAFSNDLTMVAIATENDRPAENTVRIWDVKKRAVLHRIALPLGTRPLQIAFSSDNDGLSSRTE